MLKKWMSFGLSGAQEERYRGSCLAADVAQARICAWLLLIPTVGFLLNDYRFFAFTWGFWGLAAWRLGLLVYTVGWIGYAGRVSSYRSYDRAAFVWGLVFALSVVGISATRPGNYLGHAIVAVVFVFLLLLVIPNRFSNQILLAAVTALGEVAVIVLSSQRPAFQAMFAVVLSVLLASVAALASAWQVHAYRRRAFAAGENERMAVEMLRQNEGRYRALFTSLNEGFYLAEILYDGEGRPCDYRYVEVNPAFERLVGLRREEIVGKRYKELSGSGGPPGWLETFAKVALTGESANSSFFSSVYRRHFEVFAFRPAEGQFAGLVTDITERKRAEEGRARLAAIVETSEDAILSTGLDGTIVSWNAGAQRLFGYRGEEISGQPIAVLRPPECAEEDEQTLERLRRGERVEHLETIRVAKDGRRIDVSVTVSPLKDGAGEVVGVSKIIRDITERKRREQEVQRLNRTLKALSNSSHAMGRAKQETEYLAEVCRLVVEDCGHAMVWVGYADGDEGKRVRPVAWAGFEEGYLQTLGITWADSERGRGPTGTAIRTGQPSVCRNIQTDPRLAPWRNDAVRRGYRSSIALPLRREGRAFGALTIYCREADPFSESEVRLLTELADDLAYGIEAIRLREARVRGEAELRQAKEAAEGASKAKDHFLAVLSHELRNPLNPVLATAGMLRNDVRLDADTREQLEVICRNVELEARLIDDLLDVTRIERGKVELDLRSIELGMVIQRAVEVCRPDIEGRKLEFGVDLGPDARYRVEADAARLQQVFWNLLKNAIKFTPVGGSVGVRCRREGAGFVVVEVNDSGVGMEPAALGRIFNAFEQAERAITRQFGGLGLGLTISKALVEMHGGTIWAQSAGKGKGATFRVRLPLQSAEVGVAAFPSTSEAGARKDPVRMLRILLVEDHGDTARIMRRLLAAEGHEVQTAGDVATALALVEERGFDLLLSDLGLPDGSGLDLMRALRARGIQVPGIALSGYGQESDVQQSREAGFLVHLTKPVNLPKLGEVMAKVVGEGRGRGQRRSRGG